jgi:hypothetical protein
MIDGRVTDDVDGKQSGRHALEISFLNCLPEEEQPGHLQSDKRIASWKVCFRTECDVAGI